MLCLIFIVPPLQIDKKNGEPMVRVYTDRNTGKPKGEALVGFENPSAAKQAIDWFDGTYFCTEDDRVLGFEKKIV